MPVKDTARFFLGMGSGIAYGHAMQIESGDHVSVVTAYGDTLARRATTGVVEGHDFPVVWVCTEDEWDAAQRDGTDPDAVPWPAEDVRAADTQVG